MVSQLSRVNSVKPNFNYIRDVYEVCLERYRQNPRKDSITFDSIARGRKALEFEEEVDAYIAFYGAHHYYKLVETFDALNISQFGDSKIDIISYGCGAATDTCSLISYCQSQHINLPFKNLKLIEPSRIALNRGVKYIQQALSPQEQNKIEIDKVYKYLNDLEKNDVYVKSENPKLHIFSNVLDLKEINLDYIASLIHNTHSGTDYFICVNPKNSESIKRIDGFYQNMSNLFELQNISINDKKITGKNIWMMKAGRYENYPIHRYHRIFKTNAI